MLGEVLGRVVGYIQKAVVVSSVLEDVGKIAAVD